jgi:hypothetical protein
MDLIKVKESEKDVLARVQEAVELAYGIAGYDPVVALAVIGNDPATPLNYRIDAHSKVLPYIYPKKVAVQGDMNISAEITHKVTLVDKIVSLLDKSNVIDVEVKDEDKS